MDSLGVAERLSDKIATCHDGEPNGDHATQKNMVMTGGWFTGMVYGIVLPTKKSEL